MHAERIIRYLTTVFVVLSLIGAGKAAHAAVSLKQIQRGIERAQQRGASIGVYIVDLSTGKVLLQYNASQRFPTASVIKLSIMGTVYWLHMKRGLKLTSARLTDLRDMIGVSSNEAANRLIALCGMERVNDFIVNQMGCQDTRLVHYLSLPRVVGPGYNVTTPYEAAHQLKYLLFDRQFAPFEKEMRSFLTIARWHQPERLVRYIDRSITCYRKPGTTSTVLNDVAYFENPGTKHRILASFFSHNGSQDGNRALSEQISRYLADLLATPPKP